jgi:hypothetical protein
MPYNDSARGIYTANSSGDPYLNGDLVKEEGFIGVATKQEGTGFDSRVADQDVIADGESFFLTKRGRVAIDASFAKGDKLYLNGSVLTSDSATDEVQTVTVANATGGTFTLTFSGQTTAAIAYNASAATVKTALEALSNIGVGDVLVSKVGTVYTISFAGALADTNVAQLTADDSSLTGEEDGDAPSVTVATTGAGGTGYDPVGIVVDDSTDPLGRIIVDLDLA